MRNSFSRGPTNISVCKQHRLRRLFHFNLQFRRHIKTTAFFLPAVNIALTVFDLIADCSRRNAGSEGRREVRREGGREGRTEGTRAKPGNQLVQNKELGSQYGSLWDSTIYIK